MTLLFVDNYIDFDVGCECYGYFVHND